MFDAADGLEVALAKDPPDHIRKLMRTLGVTIREDERLPRPRSWRKR